MKQGIAETKNLHEAMFYGKKDSKNVKCGLCNRRCLIADGARGLCGVRKNLEGKLYSLAYGKTLTMEIDPVEKKPLYHFRPGSRCLGISTFGCNFMCKHCQNFNISQAREESTFEKVPFTSPEKIVQAALDAKVEGIAYTYNEPTIFAEYALDIMKLARKKNLYNVWVSNGYMTKEAAEKISPLLDAINIDLKGDKKFYNEIVGNADVEFVKENIKYFHKKRVHIEVTNLIIPGCNDDEKNFREIAKFIKSVSEEIPLHFSRFYPMYKLDYLPATDPDKIKLARDIALKEGLKHVYLGNLREESDTFCKKCGSVLIKRIGYSTEIKNLDSEAKCKTCGTKSNIIL